MTVGTRRIIWQGGEHDFCIAAIGNLLALEQACNAGVAAINARLATGTWYVNDVRETIRLGLIGGGMSAEDAMKCLKANVDANPRGLAPSVLTAMAVLEAALIGVPDDPVGKTPAPDAQLVPVSSTTMAASGARPSME